MDKIFNFFASNQIYYYIVLGSLFLLAILSTVIIVLDHKKNKRKNFLDIIETDETSEKEREIAKLELEKIMKEMNENLEKRDTSTISSFEQEQEEKAIISYQELIDCVGENNTKTEQMSFDTIEKSLEKDVKPLSNVTLEVKEEPQKKINKDGGFRQTEFISPIFGKITSEITYPTIAEFRREAGYEHSIKSDFSQMVDPKELDEEIRKSTEFLNALKEFRRNL